MEENIGFESWEVGVGRRFDLLTKERQEEQQALNRLLRLKTSIEAEFSNEKSKKQKEGILNLDWEQVIADFFEKKRISEEEKFLKELFKKLNQEFADHHYFEDENIEYLFDAKRFKREKDQSSLDFLRLKLKEIYELNKTTDKTNFTLLIEEYIDQRIKIDSKYTESTWLTWASSKASSVKFATHVPKLTHSKIDVPPVYDRTSSVKDGFLTTTSLKNKIIDGAVAGNQFAPIFQFLELELNGVKLASNFLDESTQLLEKFDLENNHIQEWNAGFRQALESKNLEVHTLMKQVYFPVKNLYHLLCVYKSSSLAHAIYENTFLNQKVETTLKKKSKFSHKIVTYYPSKAKLAVTASNHNNASQLNGKRGGKLYLYSSRPPVWKTQNQLKHYRTSLFDDFRSKSVDEDIEHLKTFLLRNQQLDLSIKSPNRLDWIEKWAVSIIDELFFYVSVLQTQPSGWLEESNMKIEHQYLLDPYRDDATFQNLKKTKEWQKVVVNDFARWLNKKLSKDKKFTPQTEHSKIWQNCMKRELREFDLIVTPSSISKQEGGTL